LRLSDLEKERENVGKEESTKFALWDKILPESLQNMRDLSDLWDLDLKMQMLLIQS